MPIESRVITEFSSVKLNQPPLNFLLVRNLVSHRIFKTRAYPTMEPYSDNWNRDDKTQAIDPSFGGAQSADQERYPQESEDPDNKATAAFLNAANGAMRRTGGPGNPSMTGPGQRVLKNVAPPSARHARPLAQTKRAEQNRKAQKAFRARKELYIKDMEEKVTQLEEKQQLIRSLKRENELLRDYILALQSKLVDVPTPPAVIAPVLSRKSSRKGDPSQSDELYDARLKAE